MTLQYAGVTGEIINAAIEVHRTLGPGYLESVYANAFQLEMETRRLPFRREVSVDVEYRGTKVGTHRMDFVVGHLIIVELKTVRTFDAIHFAVVRSYLRAMHCEHGLLLNFALLKLQAKRVGIRNPPAPGFLNSWVPDSSEKSNEEPQGEL